ncbi:MAG: hypothetical protein KIT20_05345 [Alphaproteobacteria bacterium]|nr:hypothetical protein [Alphaproteobacteria bacterium]
MGFCGLRGLCAGLLTVGLSLAAPARADGFFDFRGSLGEKGGHKRYVPALSNPLFNETPYITTELRPIYLHQDIPNDFLTRGGSIDLGAAELRIALTDRLGFIASKDGYGKIRFKKLLPDDSGFANISFGFKYAVISDPAQDLIVTLGAEYEPPSGNLKAGLIRLQGDGDGFLDLFVTGAKAFGKLGLQGSVGTNLAIDGDHDSSMLHYSAHASYELLPNFFPLVEFNGFTTISKGKRTVANFEGVDLVNFGSTESGTVATMAVGARYRFNRHFQIGAGYEFPVTEREDILNWRVYFDAVITF